MAGTEIRFVKGTDAATDIPAFVKRAGLTRRFAVIQETYRPDSVNMYFDEKLWRALVAFVVRHAAPGQAVVVEGEDGTRSTVDEFLAAWDGIAKDEREPPPYVVAGDAGSPILCMATEYWNRVGGPMPYHDSYTYSLFSNEDLGPSVMDHLRQNNDGAWDLARQPTEGVNTFWRRLRLRLGV